MSVRASTCWPRACSGDMYAAVPTTVPASVLTPSCVRVRTRWPDSGELRQTEVQHLHDAVRPEHHVLRLDVAVDDPGRVRDAQGGRHLNGDVERLTQRELRRGEPLPEGLPLDVLHRDVVLALARLDRARGSCRRSGD